MKGLLVKDLKLVLVQKYIILLVIGLASIMTARSDDPVFGVAYMSFIGTLLALMTISSDEADHGNAFLFTLPISRKGYVAEKYLFGLLLGGASWLTGTLIALTVVLAKDSSQLLDMAEMTLLVLPLLFGMLSLMFPFQLKFGGEKGRIVIVVVIGLVCLAGVGIQRVAGMFHIDLFVFWGKLLSLGMGAVTALGIGAGLLALFISYRISVTIMNKKEF